MSGRVFQVSFAVVLAGCSFQASCGGKKLDTDKVEAELGRRLQEAGGFPATVTCPESKLEKGKVIECTTDVQGVKGRAKVTQDDDQGHVSFEFVEGYVFAADAEKHLALRVKEQTGVDGKVNCGERVRRAVVGEKFRCVATADVDGDTLTLEATVTNVFGGFSFQTVPDAPAPQPAAPPAEVPAPAPAPAP